MIKEGVEIYGTIEEQVFGESFIQRIQDEFEEYVDEEGYPDMNWRIDYSGEDFRSYKRFYKKLRR